MSLAERSPASGVEGVTGLRSEAFEDEPEDSRRFLLEAYCRRDPRRGGLRGEGLGKRHRDPSGVELSHSDSFPRRIALGGHHSAVGFAA